jgi:hypothetical protein
MSVTVSAQGRPLSKAALHRSMGVFKFVSWEDARHSVTPGMKPTPQQAHTSLPLDPSAPPHAPGDHVQRDSLCMCSCSDRVVCDLLLCVL